MSGRGLAGLAGGGVAACCGVPLLLTVGATATVAGLGLGSWGLVVAGAVLAAAGAVAWRSRRRRRLARPITRAAEQEPPIVAAVRVAAFDALRHGRAPTVEELADRTSTSPEAVSEVVAMVVREGRAQVDGARVIASGGLSSRPTRHRLALDGVALHTWCALDAVGIPAALGADALAQTACPHCGRVIEVRFEHGRPQCAEPVVVWVPAKACSNVVEEFCPEANLFCGRDHLDAWRREAGQPRGRALSLPETARLGTQIWAEMVPVP